MVEPGMHIVIGLSGGPDSLCMFDILCGMAEDWQLKLYPVHVNHKFRPGAAEADQDFVEGWCRQTGWPCRTVVRDCSAVAEAEGLTPEEAGRKVRYEAFAQTANEIAAGSLPGMNRSVPKEKIAIAVGQNADDQAETVLFRILRGTGVDGLAGIAYKRWNEKNIAVIRPLLDVSRSEIEEYCAERNLMPRRDHTNEEPVYMRNRIRLQLLPLIRDEYNANITAGLNRLAESAAVDSAYLWQEAVEAYSRVLLHETGQIVEFSLGSLGELHQAIRIRLYHKALEHIGLCENISAAHLEGIEAVFRSDRPSASWNLPKAYIAEKRYDRLCFYKVSNFVENGQLQVIVHSSPIDDATRDHVAKSVGNNVTDRRVLSAELDGPSLMDAYGIDAAEKIVLRTRQTGDYMTISTGGGLHRKKLQDILVDMKIPKSLRDQVKLAAIGSEVLWILPGELQRGRKTAAYRPEDNGNRERIVLEYLYHL